jgi:hypothetical protein
LAELADVVLMDWREAKEAGKGFWGRLSSSNGCVWLRIINLWHSLEAAEIFFLAFFLAFIARADFELEGGIGVGQVC